MTALREGSEIKQTPVIVGRTLLDDVVDPSSGELVATTGDIKHDLAEKLMS